MDFGNRIYDEKEIIDWNKIIKENENKIQEVTRNALRFACYNPLLWVTVEIDKQGNVYYLKDIKDIVSHDCFCGKAIKLEKFRFQGFDFCAWTGMEYEEYTNKWLIKHDRQDILEEAEGVNETPYKYLTEGKGDRDIWLEIEKDMEKQGIENYIAENL